MRTALVIVALIAPVEEIIELTEKIFKSRIISQEGPGRPEGQVLPSEVFTVTRVTTEK